MSRKHKLYLFDAMALIYRAHFAFINNPLINSKGFNVSAVTGFTNTLHEILTKYEPTHAAVVFDAPGPTDRVVEHSFYKANREAAPEDLVKSIPYIKQIVAAMNIPCIELAGYEADDLIGTIAKKAVLQDFDVYMVTPDKDFAQLVEDHIFIHKPPAHGKGHEILDLPAILEKWEVERPEQVIDILGMWGDAVDNIPGIPGVGEKTAKKFIKEFGSIENLLENTDKLKGKMKEKVEANKEQAMISKQLATIILDAPVIFDINEYEIIQPDKKKLTKIFTELEFKTLGKRIIGDAYNYTATTPNPSGQMDLFAVNQNDAETEQPTAEALDISNVDHQYHLVQTEEEIKNLASLLSSSDHFCFDSETTGLDANDCELVGLSFAIKAHEAYYLPIPSDRSEALKILASFKPILENNAIVKIGQNIKFDMLVLKWYDIDLQGIVFDTMVAHYILDADARHNMNALAESYLGYTAVSIESLIGKKGPKQGTMRNVPLEKITEYAAEDADITYQLYEILNKDIKENGFEKLYNEVEGPLIPVLTQMEKEGVAIDTEFLNNYSKELEEDINKLKANIFEAAGESFNMDSPKQLGEVLFEEDKMGIPYKGKKTKTGQYSTNEETLSSIQGDHPIIKDVLEYRELAKLKSTYVDALPKLVNPKSGLIHTTFAQTIAATGRLSSIQPNLQNIPIRTEKGRKVRQAFIPRSADNVLLAADYSQVELRIVAAISNDEKMIEAFQNGIDIHSTTAANVFGVKLEDVDADMRRKAKVVNFGIIYGISAFGLSQRLSIPRKEAADIIEAYFEQYSGIKKYMSDIVDTARENGYVETIMGRKRYLRDINSRNYTSRSFAERNAINTPIQGSAADIIKMAMIKIQNKIKSENLASKMVLQVHDELLFDVPNHEIEILKPIVKKEMQGAVDLKVPLLVEIGTGQNWLQAH
ncbi:MAG: DNA polymerase I [Chitinophagales bacterium]